MRLVGSTIEILKHVFEASPIILYADVNIFLASLLLLFMFISVVHYCSKRSKYVLLI